MELPESFATDCLEVFKDFRLDAQELSDSTNDFFLNFLDEQTAANDLASRGCLVLLQNQVKLYFSGYCMDMVLPTHTPPSWTRCSSYEHHCKKSRYNLTVRTQTVGLCRTQPEIVTLDKELSDYW